FVAVPLAGDDARAHETPHVPSALHSLELAQAADEEEPFGDPPPPPPLSEESEAAPAPAVEPAPSVSSSREQRREERRLRREGQQQQRPRARAKAREAGPVNAMMAGLITAIGGLVVAVPAAGFCGICTCLAC